MVTEQTVNELSVHVRKYIVSNHRVDHVVGSKKKIDYKYFNLFINLENIFYFT